MTHKKTFKHENGFQAKGELVYKSKQTFKIKVKRNFFCADRITNFDKPIFNQSSFTQNFC